MIKTKRYTAFDLENKQVSAMILDKYEIENINLLPLLFQTGYLTIKSKDLRTRRITLDYPNFEVEEAFSVHMLSKLTIDETDKTSSIIYDIVDTFSENNIEGFINSVNSLLSKIPYTIAVGNRENYYHSLFFLIMKMIGFNIEAEILTINGRIDAVVKTEKTIFIIEFKVNQSAEKAIIQIKEKKYANKYAEDKRELLLLGINFDTDKKMIDDYIITSLPRQIP